METVGRDFYKPVADNIRQAREKANLTQKMLAGAIGLSRAAIANIESGRQQILLHTLYDIAEACNTDPVKLLPPKITNDQYDESLRKELKTKLSAGSVTKILNRLKHRT